MGSLPFGSLGEAVEPKGSVPFGPRSSEQGSSRRKPRTTCILMHPDPRTCSKMRVVPGFATASGALLLQSAWSQLRGRTGFRRKPRTTCILMHWRGQECTKMRVVPDFAPGSGLQRCPGHHFIHRCNAAGAPFHTGDDLDDIGVPRKRADFLQVQLPLVDGFQDCLQIRV